MDTGATEFATKVTKIDWATFHRQRRELVHRYAFDPSDELEGLISFLEDFQRAAAELLGRDVVFPGVKDVFEADDEFCQKMLRERGYIYCPHCLNDDLDSYGHEDSRKHTYQVMMCRHCGQTIAIRYDNPTLVTAEEMEEDLKQNESLDLSKVEGA